MTSWITLLRLVKKIGLDVVLPLVRAIHDEDETSAQEKVKQALTARAAGRAAYEASKSAGKP